jgi:hypothetical protein
MGDECRKDALAGPKLIHPSRLTAVNRPRREFLSASARPSPSPGMRGRGFKPRASDDVIGHGRADGPGLDSEAQLSPFEPIATAFLRTRVDAQRAAAAKKILEGLGLYATTAVNLLFA